LLHCLNVRYMTQLNVHDVVALLKSFPEKSLKKGQVGTIVEKWSDEVFEVEFSDNNGKPIAIVDVMAIDLLLLHFEATAA